MEKSSLKSLHLTRSAIATNLHCNLKCKLCGAYSPYYKDPIVYSYENITHAINAYFEIVQTVDKFTITGGEPLLHWRLTDILLYLLTYEKQIGCIEIITNGTVLATAKLLNVCQKTDKINFLIDDYGSSLSKKVVMLETALTQNQIKYKTRIYYGEHTHCGGWVDYGDLTYKSYTQEQLEKTFESCIQHKKLDFCLTIVNGKLFPCSVSRRCFELGIVSSEESEFVDLFDDTVSKIDKQIKINDIYHANYLRSCAYCNGFSVDSPRYPPAEQLE